MTVRLKNAGSTLIRFRNNFKSARAFEAILSFLLHGVVYNLGHCLTLNFLDIRYAAAKSPAPKSTLFVKDLAVARRSCNPLRLRIHPQILLAIVLPAPLGFSMRNDTECGHIS